MWCIGQPRKTMKQPKNLSEAKQVIKSLRADYNSLLVSADRSSVGYESRLKAADQKYHADMAAMQRRIDDFSRSSENLSLKHQNVINENVVLRNRLETIKTLSCAFMNEQLEDRFRAQD